MAQSTTDRNLLFGILAIQMDFITRDALIAAMETWVTVKDKPVGQVLQSQGALAEDDDAIAGFSGAQVWRSTATMPSGAWRLCPRRTGSGKYLSRSAIKSSVSAWDFWRTTRGIPRRSGRLQLSSLWSRNCRGSPFPSVELHARGGQGESLDRRGYGAPTEGGTQAAPSPLRRRSPQPGPVRSRSRGDRGTRA